MILNTHREFWLRNDKSITYFQILDMTTLEKKTILYIVVFCKYILSKMASTKRNKNKKANTTFRLPTFKVTQLCFFVQNDIFTLKVLETQLVSVKRGSALILNIQWTVFDIEAEPFLKETKCNFRTFRVKISFWTKKQSCITLKVGNGKWCCYFFVFCFCWF